MKKIERDVHRIIERVRQQGDRALVQLSLKYDRACLQEREIRVGKKEISSALKETGPGFGKLVRSVAGNIAAYHKRQMPREQLFTNAHGASVGWFYRPVERAGIYIPGGTAPLISSFLMTIIPAQTAGVREIIGCTPPGSGGEINPYILSACSLLGLEKIFRVGGAQAIAAMAFGTERVPAVDIIAGPGNKYVTEAKRQLYGKVGIDMTAGPSEVAIIAGVDANPAYVAADLLSQVEHLDGRAVLLTTSLTLIDKVREEMALQAKALGRTRIVQRLGSRRLSLIRCKSLAEALEKANRLAPEHLEIMTRRPRKLIPKIRNAGAVFIGTESATALGDYVAGPSHVLPTGGSARFFSVLSVDTFLKRVSLIEYDSRSLAKASPTAERLAELEGLESHAESLRVRKRFYRRGLSSKKLFKKRRNTSEGGHITF